MEFGKVHNTSQLDKIDWQLPSLDPVFSKYVTSFKTRLWVGAPAWSHKEWVGKIYPEKTKAADYLSHYAKYFNTIELNTSHYRIPTQDQTNKWVEKVTPDFLFCPKIFQGISHDYIGINDPVLINQWIDFLKKLGQNCGPSFLQLPPHFSYNQKTLLFKFLQLWPDDFKLALEFRHPSWFQDGHILPALTQYLQSRNIGLVTTDVAGRRDVLHSSVSANFSMTRFIGNDLHETDYVRAIIWNERLEQLNHLGIQDVFFFVHEPDDICVPEMTEFFRTLSFFERQKKQHEDVSKST